MFCQERLVNIFDGLEPRTEKSWQLRHDLDSSLYPDCNMRFCHTTFYRGDPGDTEFEVQLAYLVEVLCPRIAAKAIVIPR